MQRCNNCPGKESYMMTDEFLCEVNVLCFNASGQKTLQLMSVALIKCRGYLLRY